MAVRKIPNNSISLTGAVSSPKTGQAVQFESSLERDFIYMLEFDNNVDSFLEQPLSIKYKTDKERFYTPDFLVKYRKDIKPAVWINDALFEVKYREDLKKNWEVLKPKFKAAKKFASENNLEFKIITEGYIRIPFLQNAKFLMRYKNADLSLENYAKLNSVLENLRETTPYELSIAACSTEMKRAEYLHSIWCMIARRIIGCDLTQPLQMDSPIWHSNKFIPENTEPCRN